jgi:acetate kinase
MGTRCGDIDPAIPFYISYITAEDSKTIDDQLNKDSGLKGICGVNDMREIQRLAASGDRKAQLAIDMYCYRIIKYIGAYYTVLQQVHALVFTAGIGENSALIRQQICAGLQGLDIYVDEAKNAQVTGEVSEIQTANSRLKIFVIRTNEELEIANQTLKCLV